MVTSRQTVAWKQTAVWKGNCCLQNQHFHYCLQYRNFRESLSSEEWTLKQIGRHHFPKRKPQKQTLKQPRKPMVTSRQTAAWKQTVVLKQTVAWMQTVAWKQTAAWMQIEPTII